MQGVGVGECESSWQLFPLHHVALNWGRHVSFVAWLWYWFCASECSSQSQAVFIFTSLILQLRVSIALHNLNCVQPISWYCMFLSYHIPIYIHSSCYWWSSCCS